MVMQRPECPFIAIDLFNKEVNTIRGCFLVKSDVKTHYTVVDNFFIENFYREEGPIVKSA